MKKLQMAGPGKSEIIELPDLKPNDNQILVKNKYCGVCMSEHHAWLTAKGGEFFGHEQMGVVAEVGKNITGFKVGDRVSGLYGGGISEYSLTNEGNLFLIPDNVRDEDATLEPLACILSAVSKVSVGVPGDTVAVVGCGYMGCGAIGLLKLKGAGKIVAVDINRESLKNALKYGADEAYTPDELSDEYLAPMNRISKGGFGLVFEWGETNESLELAIKMTKMCGTGVGISISANKVDGIRAVVCSEPYSAKLAREHNNANIVAFGARVIGTATAEMIIDEFLNAKYEGGRHQKRLDMISQIEQGVM